MEYDSSIMTYRGHIVNRYGMRCHFSPVATTGQKYIYTGHEKGQILSKFLNYLSIYQSQITVRN